VFVPLTGLDTRGRTYPILDPPWPVRRLASGGVVELRRHRVSKPRVSLPVGGRLTWRFVDRTAHNLLYANGPRLVGTPTLSRGRAFTFPFTVAGHYELFCYLHPVTMHQVVDVVPREGGPSTR
jgi:hypothetical protein